LYRKTTTKKTNMKVSDFWKEYQQGRKWSDFDANEFISLLSENVPDWREQIKDKSIWPELHTYANSGNDGVCLLEIIKELGVEFACFILETPPSYFDEKIAINYCVDNIDANWKKYQKNVRERVVKCRTWEYFDACNRNPNIWFGLDLNERKEYVEYIIESEKILFHDVLMFNLWKSGMNFQGNPYLKFSTGIFRLLKSEIVGNYFDASNSNTFLDSWEMPRIEHFFEEIIEYFPSERLKKMEQVLTITGDRELQQLIQNFKEKMQGILKERL